MDGKMGQEPGWQQPRHGAGPPSGPVVPSGYPPAILIGFGVIVVLVVAIGVVLVTGDDSSGREDDSELTASSDGEGKTTGEDEESGASENGGEPAEEEPPEAEIDEEPGEGEGEESDTPEGGIEPADLPPPEIPDDADPPPMTESLEGMTFPYDPFNGVDWPTIGGTLVEVTPGEHVDLAVHLEPGELVVSFPGNDGIFATVEVYGPDGEVVQIAEDLGEPGSVEWLEFTDYSGDAIQEAGTYVFRVIQHDGPADGMAIGFFAPPE
jgi:hypothetical protein